MRAWTFVSRGSPSEILHLQHDYPQPQPTDLAHNEVLIEISHAALFASEVRLMSTIPHFTSNPWIPAFEFSGTIAAFPDAKTSLPADHLKDSQIGDAVFGMINPKTSWKYNGASAEYIIAPRESVMPKPSNISFDQAAGLGGGGCTVIGIAEEAGLLKIEHDSNGPRIVSKAEGKNILVTGGSTGTGLFMVQLAKTLVGNRGNIVATCSPKHNSALQELGVNQVIDYTAHPNLHAFLAKNYSSQPFDTIIDISGSDPLLYPKSPAYLKSEGYFVFAGKMSVTHTPPSSGALGALNFIFNTVSLVASWQWSALRPVILGGTPRKCFFHSGTPGARLNEHVRQLVEDGTLKGIVDSVWDMEDLIKAYEYLAKGKIRGKVVVRVQS